MAAFISTRRNNLSNGLIRRIRLSETSRYIRIIQVKSLVYGSYVCERDSCLISLVYEIHTIAFFGPLAQPNNQMYSVVTTIKNVFTSHTACICTQQNLQI